MRVLLLLLFVYLQGCYGEESVTQLYVHRGQSTSLTCPIEVTTCGELHSIKWFKGTERIAVASGDGKFTQIEGDTSRLHIEFKHGKSVRLGIKSVTIEDEDLYSCEITYLEPPESCDTTGEYQINLVVVVNPSAVLIMHKDEIPIRNGSTIGPLKEGHRLETICKVVGARPKPTIGWYRGGKKLYKQTTASEEEHFGTFTVNSKLSLILSREDLSQSLECRVKTIPNDPIISNQIYIDLEVRPTRIVLNGVRSHAVEGSNVMLQCDVFGARPAANISWYNSSKLIDDENERAQISVKVSPERDGTQKTTSQLIFNASRFDTNALFRCEADNIVMRNDMEKPLHETLPLEVLYPPLIYASPGTITVNETGEFLLSCEYDSNPLTLLSVRWLQDNTVLNLNQSRFDGGTPELQNLVVKNATREDTGTYVCELSNQVGTGKSEQAIYVDVQYKPTVSIRFEPPSPIIENDHVNVTLHCDVVDGNPRKLLKVQWMMNGDLLTELPECNENSFKTGDDEDDDEDTIEDYDSSNNKITPKRDLRTKYSCSSDQNPTKIFLQNVNRVFMGNYSCRGYNLAGWGEESETKLLNIFYEPGNASISVHPPIPSKRRSMTLNCSVGDAGNPKSTRFHWLRGDDPVKDIVSKEWIIDPVTLHSRNNFSCYAVNEGGNGTMATINVDVQVSPAFIKQLPQYSGFLYSEPNIMLSCRIECVPECSIYWYRDGDEITNANPRYFIKNRNVPADKSTGDFESILSELHFNITAWPNRRLDILKDSANYTCISSNNSVGTGVRSATSFGVEYPPQNVSVSQQEVQVIEGKTPARILCTASAHPAPKYRWKRLDTNEDLSSAQALTFSNGLNRTDKGVYSCIVENKHGSNVANITMNILYAPNCTITRKEEDGEDTLICTADGNPEDYQYQWDFKSENETDIDKDQLQYKTKHKKSFLILGDVPQKRIYVCRANNTVGPGLQCEISVEGHLMWWHKLWPLTPLIIVALIVACLIAVIILICIIICMCRRRRKRSSKSMEKSLVDNKPYDPHAEPCENYENLPFHGLQNPPTKFNYITAPTANNHNLNVNLVHQQQKPYVSHGPPYPSEHYCYETSGRSYNSSTPNNNSSTIRSVKNYRKPHPPSSNVNYNIMNMNASTTTSSNSSYSNPLTNNLNNNNNNNSTYKFNNVSQSNNLNHSNTSYHSKVGVGSEHSTVLPPYSNTNLSRRSSQSSGNHEYIPSAEKAPHSLSLCINRINLKKSNNSNHSSSTSSSSSSRRRNDGAPTAPQFQSMRCRKHRNRNHFFNTSSSTSYQKYKLTKSCSNDTVNSSEQPDLTAAVEKNPQTTYKFI